MQRSKFGPILLVAVMVIGARPAHAQTTLTFDANACSGTSAGSAGPTYIESGFMLSFTGPNPTDAYAYWCSGNVSYPGSPAIFENWPGSVVTLTKVGGGTFTLTSIDLAPLYNPSVGIATAGSVLFTGDLFGGGTVTATQSWDAATGNPTFKTDAFSNAWTNLVDVTFPQGNGHGPLFQFDNVVLNGGAESVVPEPATMTLFATGLVGLVGAGLRRRKKA